MSLVISEAQLETPEVTINYATVLGVGTPIMLLHWASGRWQRWLESLEALSLHGPLYAPDARGHGKSGRTPGRYRFVDHARDVEALLREVVGEPAVLIGHSLGGMQAAMVAAQSPELVRGAVLVEPSLFVPERGLDDRSRGGFQRVRSNAGRKPEDYASSIPPSQAESLSQLDPEAMTPWLDGSVGEGCDTAALLAAIRCPVLLLRGDPDLGGVLQPDEVQTIQQSVGNCEVVFVEGAGHDIPRTFPEQFQEAVARFLSGL